MNYKRISDLLAQTADSLLGGATLRRSWVQGGRVYRIEAGSLGTAAARLRNDAHTEAGLSVKPSPPTGEGLYPSAAGGLARGGFEAAGSCGDSLGAHATGRHQLLNARAAALGALGLRGSGRKYNLFETVAAGAALIFVNGHGTLLLENIGPILISNQGKSI